MTLLHIFLINRYKSDAVHYLTPTKDNEKQTAAMKKMGIYKNVNSEIGQIIVAKVNSKQVKSYTMDNFEISELFAGNPSGETIPA